MFLEAAPHLCARDDPPVDVRDPPRVPPPEIPSRDPSRAFVRICSGRRSSPRASPRVRPRPRGRRRLVRPPRGRPVEAASDVDAEDARVSVVDVNSGGAVFFCVFAPDSAPGSAPDSAPARERILVVKFCANRLAAQSEYFAHEIARAVGVVVPDARLLRKTAAPLPGAPVDSAPTPEHSAPSTAPSSAPSSWAAASRAAKSLSEAYEAASEEIRADASPEDEDPFDFASAAASFASHLDKHLAALALRFVRGERSSTARGLRVRVRGPERRGRCRRIPRPRLCPRRAPRQSGSTPVPRARMARKSGKPPVRRRGNRNRRG